MRLLTRPSSAAYASLLYITAGGLITVWSVVYFIYLRNNPPGSPNRWYWCMGFLLTGLVFTFIGLGVGRVGRSARQADVTVDVFPLPAVTVTNSTPVAQPVGASTTGLVAAAPSPSLACLGHPLGLGGYTEEAAATDEETVPPVLTSRFRHMSGTLTIMLGVFLSLAVTTAVVLLTDDPWYALLAMPATLITFVAFTKWF